MNDEQATAWIRERVAQQLRDNPDGPTLLDAVDAARHIAEAAERETDQRFWDIVRAG